MPRSWRRQVRVESADDPRYHRYPSLVAAHRAAALAWLRLMGLAEPEPEPPVPPCPVRRRARAIAKEAAS